MASFILMQSSSKTAHGGKFKMMTIVVVVLLAAASDYKWAGPLLVGATTVSQSESSHVSGKLKENNDDATLS